MFFLDRSTNEKDKYENLLSLIASLSKLSSDNNQIPYIHYRIVENIFCKAFNAINLSRSDIAIDAKKESFGIGIKTFLHKNGKTLEKIAEFNKDKSDWDNISNIEDKIIKIAKLRNKRLLLTSNISDVSIEKLLYHCITRDKEKLLISETGMSLINIDKINNIKENKNIISFQDQDNEYSFNSSKSTLYQRFNVSPIYSFPVSIYDDPFDLLMKIVEKNDKQKIINPIIETIILPLYSEKNQQKLVHEKSGLNQWNASGRVRDFNEVYIPIPVIIHKNFPNFFPDRDADFTLSLPDTHQLRVKVCQDGGKALMSNPNKALGDWLLRKVLMLKEGELLTYNMLEDIGIDSIQINKMQDLTFSIDFREIGTYEVFKNNLLL